MVSVGVYTPLVRAYHHPVRVHHDQILAAMVVAYRFRNGTELTSKCFVVWYKAPSVSLPFLSVSYHLLMPNIIT